MKAIVLSLNVLKSIFFAVKWKWIDLRLQNAWDGLDYPALERKVIIKRVEKYKKYPNLVKNLPAKAILQYKFESSLDPINIPPFSSAWKNDFRLIPCVSQKMFYAYAETLSWNRKHVQNSSKNGTRDLTRDLLQCQLSAADT